MGRWVILPLEFPSAWLCRNTCWRRAARRRQPDSSVDKAGLGVRVVSDMGQTPKDMLKKCNRPNARQLRHRRKARSPVEEIAFCAPHRVVICVASLQ